MCQRADAADTGLLPMNETYHYQYVCSTCNAGWAASAPSYACPVCGRFIGIDARFVAAADRCDRVHVTPRQAKILKLARDGLKTREIAAEVSASVPTVKRDLRLMFDLFGARTRAQAVAEAQRRGLI